MITMTTKFRGEADAEYLSVLTRLKGLPRQDDAGRCYADAVHERLRADWERFYKVRESPGRACIWRLLGKRCDHFGSARWTQAGEIGKRTCLPPATDHPSLWLRDGKPVVFVSQPYFTNLDYEALRQIVAVSEQLGLEAAINPEWSWHFPGRTALVQWWAPGARIKTAAESAIQESPGGR